MAVGLGDAPQVGKELAGFVGREHLHQLARQGAGVRTHPGPDGVVGGVDHQPEKVPGDVGRPAAHAVNGSLSL